MDKIEKDDTVFLCNENKRHSRKCNVNGSTKNNKRNNNIGK